MVRDSLRLFHIAFKKGKRTRNTLFLVLLLEAISIAGLYFLNAQYGFIYQGIQDYNVPLIYKGIATFSAIAGFLVLVGGILTYYTNKLAFVIREKLTDHFLINYDKLKNVDNIGQRIQEDLKLFGERSCEFWLTVLRSIVKLPIFLGVIMTLTKWYIGVGILIAVIIGTYLTKIMTKKLIQLQSLQETNEAEFRVAVTKYRKVPMAFLKIHSTFTSINKEVKKLSFLQSGLGQTFVLLPFIVLMPFYVSKVVTMGAFMQSVNALSKVIDSLTVLIDNRQLIANISTTTNRIKVLTSAVEQDKV